MTTVLMVHNLYQQYGGEDSVVAAEVRLLEAHGHRVVCYYRHNDELRSGGAFGKLVAGINTVWAQQSLCDVRTLIATEKPDIAHFHNTFPLISPSVYYACAAAGVPVLQTLHNFRLLCPCSALLREGKVCEECLGRSIAWPAIQHRCYRESYSATAAAAVMVAAHRAMGTWQDKIDTYIALSEFARQKFIDGGLPADRISVKPNFVYSDPGPKRGPGEYALFVGRLSEEKGLRVLLRAWQQLDMDIPLRIAGDGPVKGELQEAISAKDVRGCTLVGSLNSDGVRQAMHGASFLVVPSVWYEGFPVTIAESFACGLPVIASRLGSLSEIVSDGCTGLHFCAGNSEELAAKAKWAWSHPVEMQSMGRTARAEYESKYTAEHYYAHVTRLWNRLGIDSESPRIEKEER